MTTTLTYYANDTWACPAGVTQATIQCWSGGSGGRNKDPGQGGNGGVYSASAAVPVTPGESLAVAVGAGGAPETAGGDSSVSRGGTPLVKATMTGGSVGTTFYGGHGGASGGGAGGGGGSSAGTAANGNAGSAGAGGIGGAGGVAPVGGWVGGAGGNDGQSGHDAPSFAAGGGGAGDGNGGFGGHGVVKITYEIPPDNTPDAFAFADVTDADPSTLYTSDSQQITGMDAGTAVAIIAGEYRINGGVWTAAAGTIDPGDTLELRATSSSESEGVVTVTITVGTVAVDWTITTGVLSSVVANIVGTAILDARIIRSRIVQGHV